MPPQIKAGTMQRADDAGSAVSTSSSSTTSASSTEGPLTSIKEDVAAAVDSADSGSSSTVKRSSKPSSSSDSKRGSKSSRSSSSSARKSSSSSSRSSKSSRRKSGSRSDRDGKSRSSSSSKKSSRSRDKERDKDRDRGVKDKSKTTATSSSATSSKRPKGGGGSSRHSRTVANSPTTAAKDTVAKPPEPPAKKGVKFNAKLKVTLIPCLKDYTLDEINDTWYQQNEYGIMEDECDATSQLMDKGHPLNESLCPRGLECWTVEGEKVKEQNVSVAIDLVWNAQIEHWKQLAATTAGKAAGDKAVASEPRRDSFDSISALYAKVSQPCLAQARELGDKDEKAVRGYLAAARSMEKARRNLQSLSGIGPDDASAAVDPTVKPILKKPASRRGSNERALSRRSIMQQPKRDSLISPGGKIRRSTLSLSIDNRSIGSGSSSSGSSSRPSTMSASLLSPKPPGTSKSPSQQQATTTSSSNSSVASASSRQSTSSGKSARRITYRPKKTKIPLSPTNSMCSALSESSAYRRTSVAESDENSLRRRLKAPIL